MLRDLFKRSLSLIVAASIFTSFALAVIAADWIDPVNDLRAPLTVSETDANVTNVGKRISNICYDLQSSTPTSVYKLDVSGSTHDAMCVAAQRYSPGNQGRSYRLDISGLKGYRELSSHILEASANLTASDGTYTIWQDAFIWSDLWKYNDEEILRKIAWLVEDGSWTYYPLERSYTASEGDKGVKVDLSKPLNSSSIYRDLRVSSDALNRYKAFPIDSSRFGAEISGLYGAAHAMASRIISGDRYHLSGTIYYSFTRNESDSATYTKGSHSAFAYGDNGSGNQNYTFRKMQLMQYMNIIANAPMYDGDIYIYSPDRRSGEGQQWLMYVDRVSDYRSQEAFVHPALIKTATGGSLMTGAEFSLYSDEAATDLICTLTDNGDGHYGNDMILPLVNNINGTHELTCYLKETKAPDGLICSDGSVTGTEDNLTDSRIFKVRFYYVYSSGEMTVSISCGGNEIYSSTYSGYDGRTGTGDIYLANDPSGKFVDGSGLKITKSSTNGFTVANTVFELYRGPDDSGDIIAEFRSDDGWKWYAGSSASSVIGDYFPVMPGDEYTVVERFVPDHYKDTGIPYTIRNTSGWTRTGENSYSHTFTVPDLGNGEVMNIDVTNDRVMSSVEITKSSDDGNISGRSFEIIYMGNEDTMTVGEGITADVITTDDTGRTRAADLPLGWYLIREEEHDGYELSWASGTPVRGEDAVVHLTGSNLNSVSLGAVNNVSTKVAVFKSDSWTGEPVSGASFRLYCDLDSDGVLDHSESDLYDELTDSDNDGIVIFENVRIGDYLIVETDAPDGYYLNRDKVSINVTSLPESFITVNGEEIRAYSYSVSDEPYCAPVRISKVDMNDPDRYLDGAIFEIFEDTDGNGRFDTDTDMPARIMYEGEMKDVFFERKGDSYVSVIDIGGTVRADLRFGTYFIAETTAPEMYISSGQVISVQIDRKDTSDITGPEYVDVTVANESGFGTTLTGDDGTKIFEMGDTVRLTDTVSYTNLVAGRTYLLEGELYARSEDGSAEATGIISRREFTVEDDGTGIMASDGTIRVDGTCEVVFEFDPAGYQGMDLVAFEVLKCASKIIAVHEDINDDDQTVPVPIIGTTLTDDRTGTHVVSSEEMCRLSDVVSYENLQPDTGYRITGILMDKETGEPVMTSSGEPITGETVFVTDAPDGSVVVEYEFGISDIGSSQLVAFETLWYEDIKVSEHADIDDEGQTVLIPQLQTTATGDKGAKSIPVTSSITLTDHVSYSNLIPGMEYVVSGILMDTATGEPFLDKSGDTVGSEVRFTADSPDGTIDVPFEFDGSLLNEGDSVVVFEEAYYVKASGTDEMISICEHKDLNNRDQTVTFSRSVPKTGDESSTGELIAGLMACIGMIASLTVLIVVSGRRLTDEK